MRAVERFSPAGILLLGAVQVVTGLVMLADAGFFYERIASFAPQNDHFVRDIGTFTLSLGLGLLWSVRRSAWRIPLLAVTAVQYALHAVNHLADIDATARASHGSLNFAAIAIGTAFVALLLRAEAGARRAGAGPREGAERDP